MSIAKEINNYTVHCLFLWFVRLISVIWWSHIVDVRLDYYISYGINIYGRVLHVRFGAIIPPKTNSNKYGRRYTSGHVQAISSSSSLGDTNRFASLYSWHYHQPVRKRGVSSAQLALIFYRILIIQHPANKKEVGRTDAFVQLRIAKLHTFNL